MLEWRCANSECVSNSKYCDNVTDCYDGTDEVYCPFKGCPIFLSLSSFFLHVWDFLFSSYLYASVFNVQNVIWAKSSSVPQRVSAWTSRCSATASSTAVI